MVRGMKNGGIERAGAVKDSRYWHSGRGSLVKILYSLANPYGWLILNRDGRASWANAIITSKLLHKNDRPFRHRMSKL